MADQNLGKISVPIEADLTKLEKTLDEAERKAKRGAEKMDKQFKKVGDGFNLSRIEQGLVKFFAAIAVFDQVGAALNRVLDVALEASQKINQTWEDTALSIGKAIPLVGQFISAGEKANQLLFGADKKGVRQTEFGNITELNAILSKADDAAKRNLAISKTEPGSSARINEVANQAIDQIARDFGAISDKTTKLVQALTTEEQEEARLNQLLNSIRRIRLDTEEAVLIEQRRAIDALKPKGPGGPSTESFSTVIGQFKTGTVTPTRRGQEQANRTLERLFEGQTEMTVLIREINEGLLS